MSKLPSLYSIEKEYAQIVQQVIDCDGELDESLEKALEINEKQLQSKSVNYGFAIMAIEGQVSNIDTQIKRLQSLKNSRKKTIERLKKSVVGAMNRFGVKEIQSDLMRLSLRRSERVIIDNPQQIKKEYMTEIPATFKSDAKKIKEAIKNGEPVAGAHIEENQSLQIK